MTHAVERTMLMDFSTAKMIHRANDTKILLLVLDGLGGLGREGLEPTELETAHTPNMDRIAREGVCGLHLPVGAGITPGSGPSHLALFGYDPLSYRVGRGVLAALGINFDLGGEDVAARGNFCTVDKNGKVTDRRAGRIDTQTNQGLCRLLSDIDLPEVEIFVEPVQDYRFLLVLRGQGLSADLADTDPQATRIEPHKPRPTAKDAEETARLIHQFIDSAREILSDQHPANMVLLRGFSKPPSWPSMTDLFGLRCAAIAEYPMYLGLSRLVGMTVPEAADSLSGEIDVLERHWREYDFFYVHVKRTDSAGEDGDFDRKVDLIEQADGMLPRILDLQPDVLILTGDHSTPAALQSHSWHPVPVLLHARHCRPDPVERFGERACLSGALGPRLPATDLMPIALANAGRLEKFGA